jgi:hypothetical protein
MSFEYSTNDFLFLTYSFVAGAKACFNYILNKDHTGDIANEDTYLLFIKHCTS